MLDHPPFLHPPQSLDDKTVHGERQRSLARGGWQFNLGAEGEAPAAPAQTLEHEGRGLLGHGFVQSHRRQQSARTQVGAEEFLAVGGLAFVEHARQRLVGQESPTHEEPSQQEFVGHAVRAREVDATLAKVDVQASVAVGQGHRAGVPAILQQQKNVGDGDHREIPASAASGSGGSPAALPFLPSLGRSEAMSMRLSDSVAGSG